MYVTLELACAPTSPYMYNVMKKRDNWVEKLNYNKIKFVPKDHQIVKYQIIIYKTTELFDDSTQEPCTKHG